MSTRAFAALVKWQVYQRANGAALLLLPVSMAVLMPGIGATGLLPLLAISGLAFPGPGTEFVFPVSARAVALSRVTAALILRVLPLFAVTALTVWRQSSGVRVVFAPLDVLAVGTAAALGAELLAFHVPRLRIPYRMLSAAMMVILVTGMVALPHAAARAVSIALLLATLAGVTHMLLSPERLLTAETGADLSAQANATDARDAEAGAAPGAAVIGAGLGLLDMVRLLLAPVRWQAAAYLVPTLMLVFLPLSSQLMSLGLLGSSLMLPTSSTLWLHLHPVPRRVQMTMLALVPLALTIAMGVGQLVPTRFSTTLSLGAPQSVVDGQRFYGDPTALPITYWMTAPRFATVEIGSPWGERVQAHTTSIGPWRFFNPYSTHPGSSAQFVAWQRARMTTAIFGRPVSRDALRAGKVPLRRTQSWSMQLMQGALFLSWTLLLVSAPLVNRGVTKWSAWRAAWLPFVPLGAWWWELARGLDNGSVVLPLLQRGLLSLEASLPSRLLAVPLALVPVALSLWLLHLRLARREAGTQLRVAAQMHAALRGAA